MGALVTVLALVVAVAAVAWPLLYRSSARADERDRDRIEDLMAARESLYRRIRELDLDRRTGKLDPAEYRSQDRTLRREAIEVLRELDQLGVTAPEPPTGEPQPVDRDAEDEPVATLPRP